jgi:RES domain-containing protein
MRVFRIEREKFLHSTLEGLGAALSSGGRWNSMNTRMVYTAGSRALAILEIAVHLDFSEDLPDDRYMVEIFIPDDVPVHTLDAVDLRIGWDAKPPQPLTQLLGDKFVRERSAAVFKVPSAIVPEEHNYLINPMHPDASKIKVVGTSPLVLDGRLRR